MAGTTSQINEKKLKRYLYGEMSDDEVVKIENKIFLDDDYFYDIINLENELIDLYIRKKLDAEELIRFENSLKKSPERQTKVANAIALQTIVDEARVVEKKVEESKPSFWDWVKKFFNAQTLVISSGMTAVLLMFLIVPIVLLIIFNLRSSSSLVAGNTSKPNSNSAPVNFGNNSKPNTSATTTPFRTPPSLSKIVVLKPATDTEIMVDADTKQLVLKLVLPDSVSNQTFSVKINETGQPIKVTSQTEKNQKVLNFTVSFDNLPQGTKKIIVQNASATVNLEYPFTIRRK